MLGFHKRHGFLRQMCRINLFSAVRHIVGTSAAERLAAPLQTHGGSKLNLYNSSSIWSGRRIRQPRSQSISCNPKLGYHNHNSIFCKHDASILHICWRTAALKDLKLLVESGGLDFTKGMDSLDKHVEQISFRQCITFWQHHFQRTVAKSSITTIVRCFAADTCRS